MRRAVASCANLEVGISVLALILLENIHSDIQKLNIKQERVFASLKQEPRCCSSLSNGSDLLALLQSRSAGADKGASTVDGITSC